MKKQSKISMLLFGKNPIERRYIGWRAQANVFSFLGVSIGGLAIVASLILFLRLLTSSQADRSLQGLCVFPGLLLFFGIFIGSNFYLGGRIWLFLIQKMEASHQQNYKND